MAQCPRCGSPVQPDDLFCEECGWNMRPGELQPPPDPKSKSQLPASVGSWKTLRWIIAGALVGGIVLGAACILGATSLLSVPPEPEVVQVTVERVVTATSTSTPINTPGPSPTTTPTNTPTPTPTTIPTTVPGTVLDPGQWWYEDGLAFWMNVAAMNPDNLRVDLKLRNVGEETLMGEIKIDMFRMVSSTGDVVILDGWGFYGNKGFSLKPNEEIDIVKAGFFHYNLANSDVKHVVVEVVGLSRIEKATWRVEIPH
jgi:hypothetical protein